MEKGHQWDPKGHQRDHPKDLRERLALLLLPFHLQSLMSLLSVHRPATKCVMRYAKLRMVIPVPLPALPTASTQNTKLVQHLVADHVPAARIWSVQKTPFVVRKAGTEAARSLPRIFAKHLRLLRV